MTWYDLTVEERFWLKVDRRGPDECWEWIAARRPQGYGVLARRVDGHPKIVAAHRLSWEIANGPIPDGQCVLHHCDNPPCCNPAHLFLGTRLDNARDRNQKGRQAKGERSAHSRLTESRVRAIHARYLEGIGVPQVAREFDVPKGTVNAIVTGRSWMHLDLEIRKRPGVLSPDRVRAIRKRCAEGEDRRLIAAAFGIKPKYVAEIIARRNWASVA